MKIGINLFLVVAAAAMLSACGSSGASLNVGDRAPDFALPDTTGKTVSLSEFADESPVLLYFHMAVG